MGAWGEKGIQALAAAREDVASGGVLPKSTALARALTPAEIAWILLIPLALATLAAMMALGPSLGEAIVGSTSDALWPPGWWEAQGAPEPVDQGRYVLAVLAPLLLAAAVLAGTRSKLRLPAAAIRVLVLAGQSAVLIVVAVAVIGQHRQPSQPPFFGVGALAAAAALTAVAVVALRREAVAGAVARLVRETTTRRAVCLALALLFATIWMLEAVTTDPLVEDRGQMNWTLTDVFAVINGRTPLVDYHVLYAKLIPYPTALVLQVFGTTALVFTTFMALLNVVTLGMVYATFRRIARSSLLALGLFVPFVAMSDIEQNLATPAMWPMRYGGAYLLAWLTVRHIAGRSPQRTWILFFVAVLLTINNLEFGLAALLASVTALLIAEPVRSARRTLALAGNAAGGALAAIAAVSLFTLARAGELPDPALLTEWPRIFTSLGWFSMPMASASLHLAVYATFVAAIGVAAVRSIRAADDILLTSMLAWSGVFGLVAGSYFIGRSDHLKLAAMFSAWSFALVLLTIAAVRALAQRDWRRPTLAELLVLFGFGLAAGSISQISLPNEEIARLTAARPDPVYRADAERFVGARTRPGEKVVILLPESFRIAHELGLTNVAPYVSQNAIVTRSQFQTLVDAARREHVRAIFMPEPGGRLADEIEAAPEQVLGLRAAGFRVTARRHAAAGVDTNFRDGGFMLELTRTSSAR